MEGQELDARAKLAAKFGENVRLGGKGSIRRKKKVERKGTAADEKKLQGALKRLGVQPIPQFEEVNLFCDDNSVIHFTNPNVQASVKDNLFVVSGQPEVKQIRELMPGILNQLGPQNMEFLKEFMQKAQEESKEDDVPDLKEGEDFENVADQD